MVPLAPFYIGSIFRKAIQPPSMSSSPKERLVYMDCALIVLMKSQLWQRCRRRILATLSPHEDPPMTSLVDVSFLRKSPRSEGPTCPQAKGEGIYLGKSPNTVRGLQVQGPERSQCNCCYSYLYFFSRGPILPRLGLEILDHARERRIGWNARSDKKASAGRQVCMTCLTSDWELMRIPSSTGPFQARTLRRTEMSRLIHKDVEFVNAA